MCRVYACELDNSLCVEDYEGFGSCGDLVAECLWVGKLYD